MGGWRPDVNHVRPLRLLGPLMIAPSRGILIAMSMAGTILVRRVLICNHGIKVRVLYSQSQRM
jgi:hypothetical protein